MRDRNGWKRYGKRLLSGALALVMAGSLLSGAAEVTAAEKWKPIPLEGARLNDMPEGNYLYFGTASVTVDEADTLYSAIIYREGDLSGEASVEVRSIDLSAVYGEDYELRMENVEITGGDGRTLLEKYMGAQENLSLTLPEDVLPDEEEPIAETAPFDEEETELPQKSALALLKEAQTGEATRELEAAQAQDTVGSLVQELLPQTLEEMDASSRTMVHFAAGESEKTVVFRIYDDSESEGTETFSLRLINAQEVEIYQEAALSVAIRDDEPKTLSTVSFAQDCYSSEDGSVTVCVERCGAEYSLVDLRIFSVGDSAVAGENYLEVNETLVFAPYETEKELSLAVCGEGRFSLRLEAQTGCVLGVQDTTEICIVSDGAQARDERALCSADGEAKSFDISLNGRSYTVEYTRGSATGKIMDTAYTPAVEVGVYYFALPMSQGGIFKYDASSYTSGAKPYGCGTLDCEYVEAAEQHQSYGDIAYYHTYAPRTGQVWASAKWNSMPGVYFQLVAPDWESTKSTFGGQKFNINSTSLKAETSWASGKFSRTQNNAALILKNIQSTQYNMKFHVSVNAVDDSKTQTPKSYLRFYGLACMYKKYQIQVNEPEKMSYLTGGSNAQGTASSIEEVPAQVTIRCGVAQGSAGYRYIFANTDTNQSNIVFNLDTTKVNGMNEKFGTLTGYTITVGSGKNAVKLHYPDGFEEYLRSKSAEHGSYADYSDTAVNNEIRRITQSLETVPCDAYFIDWIDSVQKSVVTEGKGYYQTLTFTPEFAPIAMEVRVLAPENGSGYFNASALRQTGICSFKAGDVLDLSATATAGGYHVAGYEYSTNRGVTWNSVTDSSRLLLSPSAAVKGYYIRPLLAENNNCIEIVCSSADAVHILGTGGGMVKDRLLQEAGMGGKYILRLADGSTAAQQMTPMVGEIYAINFLPYSKDGSIYRPVITDANGDKYITQTLYYTARSTAKANVLRLTYEKIEGALTEYTITGTLVSNYQPIVSTATTNRKMPISGYTAALPAGTMGGQVETVSTTSDRVGSFTLAGIWGKSGDCLPMLVGNGVDLAVVNITLGSGAELELGDVKLPYPDNGPYVSSLSYSYGRDDNNNRADNTSNSINILDDSLTITAVVNDMGHKVTKAIFTVYTINAVTEKEGNETSYVAMADPDNAGVFTVKIRKMSDSLFNGDHIRVRLITETSADGLTYSHEFPDVETGYVFKTENVEIVPKTFDTGVTPTVNVPLLGAVNASASTGLLTLSRTDWTAGTGYTYSVNIDILSKNKAIPNLTNKEKLGASMQLHTAARLAQKLKSEETELTSELERLKSSSTYIASQIDASNSAQTDEELANQLYDVENQIRMTENQIAMVNEGGKQAKNAVGGYGKNSMLKVDLLVLMAFDFVRVDGTYNAATGKWEGGEYVFSCGSVSFGGSVNFSKSIYFVVYGFPLYLNASGLVQGDLTVSYPCELNEETAQKFDSYSGNLAEYLASESVNMTLLAQLKFSAGVGMCNVIGGGGAVTGGLQCSVPLTNAEKYGVLLSLNGALYFDVLVGRVNLNLATGYQGFGTYKNKTGFDFFGGGFSIRQRKTAGESEMRESQQSLSFQNYAAGTSDFSGFGSSRTLRAMPQEVERTVLLDNAGDRTAPQLLSLGNGKKMILFIGNRGTGDSLSSRALYWSVYDNGAWSAPQILADDGTFDAKPAVLQKNGRVVAAWVDADGTASGNSTAVEKLHSLGISMAVYENGAWSEEIELVHDGFFNFAPQLNLVGDTLYCSYMKRDLSGVTTEEGLLDYTGTYSTMAYVACDVAEKKVIDNGDRETYITIEHPDLTDPLVLDYHCVTTQAGGEDYMLAAYTVDEDTDLSTDADRELFLSIANLSTGKRYYPIALTNDAVNQAAPKLTELDGMVYLTWLENGYLFHLMNVTQLLESFFCNEAVGNVYRDSLPTDQSWYRRTAAELGLRSGDGSDDENDTALYYGDTFYELAAQGIFRAEQTNFQAGENANSSVSDYILTGNGDDLYVFYTDFGSADIGDLSRELYGVRYQRDMDEDDGVEETWGFGTGVKITDYGKVIDEFALTMDENDRISVVSNHYSQSIAGDGTMREGTNQLVEIEFVPSGSVSIADGRVDLPHSLVGGSNEKLSLSVVNDGLMTATGFDVTVAEPCGETETVVYSQSFERELDSGETCELELPWTIPADLTDTQLRVTVSEKNVAIRKASTVTVKVPCASSVVLSEPETVWENGKCCVHVTATNYGNRPVGSGSIQLSKTEEPAVLAEMQLPALASGESAELELSFVPAVDAFSALGLIDLQVCMVESGKQLDCVYTRLAVSVPSVAELNGGAERLTLQTGTQTALQVAVGPWSANAGQAHFSSSDPSVATVDQNGMVTGTAAGTAVITVSYAHGASDRIEVEVTDPTPDREPAPDAGESNASATNGTNATQERETEAKEPTEATSRPADEPQPTEETQSSEEPQPTQEHLPDGRPQDSDTLDARSRLWWLLPALALAAGLAILIFVLCRRKKHE